MSKEKKKSKKGPIAVIALAVLLSFLGFGTGKGMLMGDGIGKEDEDTAASLEDVSSKESSSEEKREAVSVAVVGNDCFYNNERVEPSEFIEKVRKMEGDIIVIIKDDNASINAYDALVEKLKEAGIPYSEEL